ncbi:MAG: ABC transporter permease, partial [Deltaproteobacteria bacterium]
MIPTLILASMLIFALAEVLPGDVGRSILGPYATEEQVQLLNEKLGANRPLVVRYVAWAGGFVTGDWGESALLEVPVRPLVLDAFWNSLLLAGFALILIVPTSVALGVFAGLRRDSVLDRTITVSSLSMTVIPEFVSGVVLLYIFAVWLKWLPVSAMPPDGSPFYERLYYLILPAIPLMFLELGYIARMARVGTVQVLSMPYIRTAVLKGLPRRRVIFGHVLRNAMVPTVTVIGSQVGWLIGGLVVIEV